MEHILKLVEEIIDIVRKTMVPGKYISIIRRLETLKKAMHSVFDETRKLRAANETLETDEKYTALQIEDFKNSTTSNENFVKELLEYLPWLISKLDQSKLQTSIDHKMFDEICQIVKVNKETEQL